MKRSSTGVQKRFRLTYDDYKRVLYEDVIAQAENISIRVFRNQMSTVEVKKNGLQNKLIKGFVYADKISVCPFDRFQ